MLRAGNQGSSAEKTGQQFVASSRQQCGYMLRIKLRIGRRGSAAAHAGAEAPTPLKINCAALADAVLLRGVKIILEDFAALHHKRDVLQYRDVLERIAGDGDDVGELA